MSKSSLSVSFHFRYTNTGRFDALSENVRKIAWVLIESGKSVAKYFFTEPRRTYYMLFGINYCD